MSDLVEALHRLTTWVPCEWKPVCTEAAAEITRLTEALEDCVAYMQGDISGQAQYRGIVKRAKAVLEQDPSYRLEKP
jgi:hypothetical protein